MATRVLLTVDTELAWRHHARGASWQENLRFSYDPAGVGVPWQLALLREHGLKACFFVDPMPAEVYGLAPIRAMVEPILAAGQEVQLHLHPCWRNAAEGAAAGGAFELTAYDGERQRALIEAARDLLVAAGAPPPVAFRSGSYAANSCTIEALRAAGLVFDSSHNGAHHPWPSALPLDRSQIAPVPLGGMIEIPVGQIEDWPGQLRHLQLCAVSFDEMAAALLHAEREGQPLVTFVSHSFEFASRDGARPNRTLCRRFERLCAFLADRRAGMPTVHFSDLDNVPLAADARPLPARRLRTARRMAEQIWANAVYERAL
ncbi:polysaccharide deacetylase [Sphingomonas parva]|uniref:Polysaccharide deacetylase n=1 Tax=Sphingomonas parva TaxID=2555898 RepID=A0A4Y8ZT68_9SPHN|nr:polysaccharide deacetylase family protein [Sphingomonas parva]TFI59218.1 polysaccharide deacetylase [Sphingomonas parva]